MISRLLAPLFYSYIPRYMFPVLFFFFFFARCWPLCYSNVEWEITFFSCSCCGVVITAERVGRLSTRRLLLVLLLLLVVIM